MTIEAYYQDNLTTIFKGDCIDVMKEMEPNSIDTIITDSPYGLEFMGKEWDSFADNTNSALGGQSPANIKSSVFKKRGKPIRGWCEKDRKFAKQQFYEFNFQWATEALRVAKPGAFLLAFGGTRTHHRLMCAVEDAGWEIRDTMAWMYGSGFPKSHDISKAIDKGKGKNREKLTKLRDRGNPRAMCPTGGKRNADPSTYLTAPATPEAQQWDGYGTALKPAWEPIIVAMKPLDGTFAQNALKWGVGGLNIDGGRIGHNEPLKETHRTADKFGRTHAGGKGWRGKPEKQNLASPSPQGRWPANVILDEEAAEMLDEQSGTLKSGLMKAGTQRSTGGGYHGNFPGCATEKNTPADQGGASRFFYCAKASRSERGKDNKHPTVKPLKLIEYLCRLTMIPTGGVVLDNFGGSGTTALACRNTGRKCILIEKDECETAVKRLTQEVFDFK